MARAKQAPHHPFVAKFLAGEGTLFTLIASLPEPREPALEAMFKLHKARSNESLLGEAFKAAETAVAAGTPDRNLAVMLYNAWASLCGQAGRFAEAKACLGRAKDMLSDETPPEIRALVTFYEGWLAGLQGDKATRGEFFRKEIAILPPTSPRYPMAVLSRALFYAEQACRAEIEDDLEFLARNPSKLADETTIRFVNFVLLSETGRAQEAELLLRGIPGSSLENIRMTGPTLPRSRILVDLLLARWRPDGTFSDLWAGSTQCLLDRKTGEALRLARQRAADDALAHLHSGFPSYALIRAELACGNAPAALRILESRWAVGYRNYLDDFFVARALLIKGDAAGAVRHFGLARRAAENHDARGRLKFEARLACEISPADLIPLLPGATDGTRAAAAPKPELPRPDSGIVGLRRLVGVSQAMAAVREAVRQLAAADAPLLITGETGVGKELVARALHEESRRAGEPFIAVNCGAIAESLLETELFGHEKGAFTGAVRAHRGLFEEAGKGTLFLDEVGETPPRLQVTLLRVLEDGEFRPVGGARPRHAACRVLAATNRELDRLAAAGAFRQDLLFRLKRLEIRIPPLRERGEDILALADHFLSEGREPGQRPVMSEALRESLLRHSWPGNVRELRNLVERMRLLNSDGLAYDLDDHTRRELLGNRPAPTPLPPPPAAPESGPGHESEAAFLSQGRSRLRRLERLRELFARHRQLTRVELVTLLKVSPPTVTADLRRLCADGTVEKIRPTPAPRTHYFALKKPPPAQ